MVDLRLYALLDPERAGGRQLAELGRQVVAGGATLVQLRDKHGSTRRLIEETRAIKAALAPSGVPVLVNDRVDVALAAGADGVHVGQDDAPLADVRELVGEDVLVGLSTHTPAQIDATDPALVDYIGVGPVHETPTKPGRPAVGTEPVRYAAAHSALPFFAIGGLDAGNLAGVIDAGASRVCVLRAITDAADPERAARELRALLDGAARPERSS
jgi:thiamine-phosphate pyrophosphorylase